MKKLLVAILATGLMASPAFAANGGGKKKARKKAKLEHKMDKQCDPQCCDPKCCDPKTCEFRSEETKACSGEEKCNPSSCSGS